VPGDAAPTQGTNRIYLPLVSRGPAPRQTIALDLYSPGGFPVRDARVVLRIGDKDFFFGGYKEDTIYTLRFELSPAEWASVNDGEQVRVLYGPYAGSREWRFGPLDKRNRLLVEQPRLNQQAARDRLLAQRELAMSPADQADLDAALSALDAALNAHNWVNDATLHPDRATSVFANYQAALTSLEWLIARAPTSEAAFVSRQVVQYGILDVMQALAAEGQRSFAATSAAPRLAQVPSQLDAAWHLRSEGHYQAALQIYQRLWAETNDLLR
jgi:tetratricopeptide (TPR) repeat protein